MVDRTAYGDGSDCVNQPLTTTSLLRPSRQPFRLRGFRTEFTKTGQRERVKAMFACHVRLFSV